MDRRWRHFWLDDNSRLKLTWEKTPPVKCHVTTTPNSQPSKLPFTKSGKARSLPNRWQTQKQWHARPQNEKRREHSHNAPAAHRTKTTPTQESIHIQSKRKCNEDSTPSDGRFIAFPLEYGIRNLAKITPFLRRNPTDTVSYGIWLKCKVKDTLRPNTRH